MKNYKKTSLTILGAGPAGLALGFFAKKKNIQFKIFEKSTQVGGNCKTLTVGDFKFDTGAHRLHDKYDEVTEMIKNLLKEDLLKVDAPSQIFHAGSMVNFPINITDVLKKTSTSEFKNILKDILLLHFRKVENPKNFKELAYSNYGKTLSDLFLINYTEKLWGEKAQKLSVEISGGRLNNHGIYNVLKTIFSFNKTDQKHLDGTFYYPKNGFGDIFEKLSDQIGSKNIILNSSIEVINHVGSYIENVGHDIESSNNNIFINTLPLGLFLKNLKPSAPKNIINILDKIKFRDLRLCILYLDIPYFSKNASMYYPDSKFPFTRIYEPKNRSEALAPKSRTCIVIEIPCSKNDNISNLNEMDLYQLISNCLIKNKLIKKNNIIEHTCIRMENAYPIIDIDTKKRIKPVFDYLKKFKNLYNIGRNAEFKYEHTHEILRNAKSIIQVIDMKSNID